MKKIICIALSVLLLLSAVSCTAKKDKDLPEKLDWSAYDRLIEQIGTQPDLQKRLALMHEAEDILMDSGGVIPLYHRCTYYLAKEGISGVYMDQLGMLYYDRVRYDKTSPDEPLQICVSAEPVTLDYCTASQQEIVILGYAIGSGLMRHDAQTLPQCDLAESYEISEDRCTYTFRLRPGLKWSDGTPLTADDLVYSWKRAASTEVAAETQNLFDCIKGYPDDLAIRSSENGSVFTVELNAPCAYFLDLCAYSSFFPVLQKQVESAPGCRSADGKLANPRAWASEGHIVTCGAYTVEDWTHNKSMTLKKNPNYHNAAEVTTETLELMLSADEAASYNAYTSGGIVLQLGRIPADVFPSLKDDPELHSVLMLSTMYMSMNVRSPFFAKMSVEDAKTFRKAVGFAIDRDFLCDVALTPGHEPAGSFVPPQMNDGTGKSYGDSMEKPYYEADADPDRARKLLESIGYQFGGDGKLKDPITLEFMFPNNAENTAVAACLQSDLAKLGITLVLAGKENSVYFGEARTGNYESCRQGWNADYNDPYTMLSQFISTAPNNFPQLGK